MSYDMTVFDPAAAPSDMARFQDWLDQSEETEASGGQGDLSAYDRGPDVLSLPLRAWFLDMIKTFPSLNGPLAAQEDSAEVTDYLLAPEAIDVGFSWSQADRAFPAALELARRHRVGIYDNQDDAVWWPFGA